MRDFTFQRAARGPRAVGFVVLWWLIIFALYAFLNGSWVILAILALCSVPALLDIYRGTSAALQITAKKIQWRSGKRAGSLARGQLRSVRLDTRLDLSLRMTLLTYQGEKLRLPYECIPKASDIEAALKAQDIPYERHHFTLMS